MRSTFTAIGLATLVSLGGAASRASVALARCRPMSVSEDWGSADIVVYGVVTESREDDGGRIVTIRVDRVWKGASADSVAVRVGDGFARASGFDVGRRVVVFAQVAEGVIRVTSRCGQSGPLTPERERTLTGALERLAARRHR